MPKRPCLPFAPHPHTLCVTLEPCNHQGRTPPCTEAIMRAGVKHVVIGTRDPNPNVTGGGINRLRQAGIEVTVGAREPECQQLIHAFATSIQTDKPWITVKRAFDAKGSMIPPSGKKTFTSPDSLVLAHRLRKKADAILTGSGTILADNPSFTVRHVPDYPFKKRWLAILDRRGRVPEAYLNEATQRGFHVILYKDIGQALDDLAHKGAQDILVEAGPTLSQTLLEAGLWTMDVTIQHADRDHVDVKFNPQTLIPFDTHLFRWDYFLPA